MRTTFASILFVLLAGVSLTLAQVEPTPLPTPDDIPTPQGQPSKPSTTPANSCEEGSACPMCAKAGKAAKPSEDDESVFAKLEQDWGDAIARHDVAFLERFEGDEYTYTGPDGIVSHKADEIDGAKAKFVRIDAFQHGDIKVRVYGETAVVTGQTLLKGKAGEIDLSGRFRWTDVFIKRNGQWQAVASQATAIAKNNSNSLE